ncbi:phosphatase PAP2 family protein [Achromobacter xylosoxidans]
MKAKFVCMAAACYTLFLLPTAHASEHTGFLSVETAPNSLEILPPPPAEDSTEFLHDKAKYESGHVLKNAARTKLAAMDADYKNFGNAFSGAFGMEISPSHTPVIFSLINHVLQDSHDYAMQSAKNHYKRVRPFVVYKNSTCTPEKDKKMAVTGSYPSGHASFGWAAALVLSEINPKRQTEILRRGMEFGESRVVCGAHWNSDVTNGRIMGAAVVAALHANASFIEMLNQAKVEFTGLEAGTVK